MAYLGQCVLNTVYVQKGALTLNSLAALLGQAALTCGALSMHGTFTTHRRVLLYKVNFLCEGED